MTRSKTSFQKGWENYSGNKYAKEHGDYDGEPIYIRVKPDKTFKSKEIFSGDIVIDYSKSGHIIGIEIINPLTIRKDLACYSRIKKHIKNFYS